MIEVVCKILKGFLRAWESFRPWSMRPEQAALT